MPGRLFIIIKTTLYLFTLFILSACVQKNNTQDALIKKQIQAVDSLIVAANNAGAISLLSKIRPQINNSDPSISSYYVMESQLHPDNARLMDLYADSALTFFNDNEKIKNYPDEYFKTLLIKGDASVHNRKFITALNYYYKAKSVLSRGNCDNGELEDHLGSIYYEQRNYPLAAQYWHDSYKHLLLCRRKVTVQKLFSIKQALLNNTGFSYQKAGMLDSANSYYLRDIKLINETDSANIIDKRYINVSRTVVYDNLGGLNLQRGNLKQAQYYINACLAIPNPNINGIRIPPLLKLAELNIRLGDNKSAADAFADSRALLNRFYKDNLESDIKWNKLYAQYLIKLNRPIDAYNYQSTYIKLRDSVDNSMADLYRLDVEREFNGLQQQQVLQDLMQKDKFKKLYTTGISIIVVLFIIIIILTYRNLKKTQKSQQDTSVHNRQLQQTLSELEHVNKNYIRIMRVMAHDLKNPISGMTGMVSLLLEEKEFSEENQYILKLIETTGINSMVMINDLLKTGLSDENEQLVKHALDINALLYDSVELLQFKAREKQQLIVFDYDNKPIMVSASHEKIWRVFNNVIGNAIKFSHAGGIIKTAIRINKNYVSISVADNGIGIPAEQKDSVFDMFTPAKKVGTDGEQPFGLGLSISKKIVQMHNGKIWFEDNTGDGTIFYIELPYLA